jgi:hypothetical protein
MTAVRFPPLNLWSAQEWYALLFHYPLLAATEPGERLDKATQVYYHQSDGNRSAPAH